MRIKSSYVAHALTKKGEKKTMTKTVILDEAKKVIYERQASYGTPENNFAQIAELWSAYLGTTIQPEDVGAMMILMKVARERHKHKHDNLVDIAGYAECVALIQQQRQKALGRDGE